MLYFLIALFAFSGLFFHTNHLAYKDGVTNHLVFWNAWWLCYTAPNVQTMITYYVAWCEKGEEAKDEEMRRYCADCALATANYISRKTNGKIKVLKEPKPVAK